MHRAYGFTIVELLIVIVVIGILAAIGVASYTNIQDRARNTQLLSSMDAWEKVLRLYHAEHGDYPMADGETGSTGHYCLGINPAAEGVFATNQCYVGTDSNNYPGPVSLGYEYSANLIQKLSSVAVVPDVTLPTVVVPITSDVQYHMRGILYIVSKSPVQNYRVRLQYLAKDAGECGRGTKATGSGLPEGIMSCEVVLRDGST